MAVTHGWIGTSDSSGPDAPGKPRQGAGIFWLAEASDGALRTVQRAAQSQWPLNCRSALPISRS
jgi:hypothetical protein